MTRERSLAYGRVMQTLEELGPSKLLSGEQERIREAADQLIFSDDLALDEAAAQVVPEIERLCRELVESGRWELDRAMRLADDLCSCGPPFVPELLVA
jgi:hypothetical protein